MSKVTIRDSVAAVVERMRSANQKEAVLEGLTASEATIKNYLWDFRLGGETLSYKLSEDGVFTIYRDANARQGMTKHDVFDKLRSMGHLESWHIRHDELQIAPHYAMNVIASASRDGIDLPKYLKAAFNDFIIVVCVHYFAAPLERFDDDDFAVPPSSHDDDPLGYEAWAKSRETLGKKPIDDDPDIDWRGQGEDDDEGPII